MVDGSVEVTCKLNNTGKRDGAQVVQLYVGKTGGIVERPEKELKQFKKDIVPRVAIYHNHDNQ